MPRPSDEWRDPSLPPPSAPSKRLVAAAGAELLAAEAWLGLLADLVMEGGASDEAALGEELVDASPVSAVATPKPQVRAAATQAAAVTEP